MEEILKKLCTTNATAGNEYKIRKEIISYLPENCDYLIDSIGNLIVTKKNKKTFSNRLVLSATMDEIGFIITSIEKNGYLKFLAIGDINLNILYGKKVEFENGIIGVIGCKPIHLQKKEETADFSNLYIDIGAESRIETEKYIKLGDIATFKNNFEKFGINKIKSKALDSRIGCCILLNLIKMQSKNIDFTCLFSAQGKIKARGIVPAINYINPDIAIFIESIEEESLNSTHHGAVIKFMDGKIPHDVSLSNFIVETAKKNNIKHEINIENSTYSGTSSASNSKSGVKTASIAVPCKYTNSNCCVANLDDISSVLELTEHLLLKNI